MKTQHTPGPWITQTDEIAKVRITDSATEGITIAEVRTRFVAIGRLKACASVEEREANARLIAAAPELLAALKTVTEHCRITIAEYRRFANEHGKDAIHPLDDPILEQARAAIAKAKGNT